MRGRKGSEGIAASLIMFIAVMGMASATTVLFKGHLDKSSSAVNEQQKNSVSVIKTNFVITSAVYNDVDTTYIYVKNTGKTNFNEDEIDLFIDGFRIPRDNSNRTIDVTSDTDTINPDVWDPDEELEIRYNRTFSSSTTHTAKVVVSNGVSDEEDFSS